MGSRPALRFRISCLSISRLMWSFSTLSIPALYLHIQNARPAARTFKLTGGMPQALRVRRTWLKYVAEGMVIRCDVTTAAM